MSGRIDPRFLHFRFVRSVFLYIFEGEIHFLYHTLIVPEKINAKFGYKKCLFDKIDDLTLIFNSSQI